jgi:hypothetical protein
MDPPSKRSLLTGRKRWILPFLPVLILALFGLARYWLTDRCSIVECEPASWAQIQGIVLRNTESRNTPYRLKDVDAYVTVDPAKPIDRGRLGNVRFAVYYVSIEKTDTETGTNYPLRYIEFDDRNLWIVSHKAQPGLITSLPPRENLKHFQDILIGPREAIRLTWDLADGALEHEIDSISVQWRVDIQESGTQSNWDLLYSDTEGNTVRYRVDAQDGKIVNLE